MRPSRCATSIASSSKHGRIPKGALVAMDSGWAKKIGDPAAYLGGPAYPNFHFPGFGVEAALWLAEKRDVTAIGVDTMSLDPGNSTTFPVHVEFLATDRYGLENLTGLGSLPRPRRGRLRRAHPVGGGIRRPVPRHRDVEEVSCDRPTETAVAFTRAGFRAYFLMKLSTSS